MGFRLLDNAIKLCPSLGLKKLVAYIFSHNTGSLELFRKHGLNSGESYQRLLR